MSESESANPKVSDQEEPENSQDREPQGDALSGDGPTAPEGQAMPAADDAEALALDPDLPPPPIYDQTPAIFEETRATEAWGRRRNHARDLRRLRQRAYLVVRRESTVGARIDMDQEKLVLGRDPATCDIVLDGTGISRNHARIERNARGYYALVDCNSRNGTYVDGRPIERMNLVSGDVFEIGHNILEFHIISDENDSSDK